MTQQNLHLQVILGTRIKIFNRGLFIRGFYPGTLKHAPKEINLDANAPGFVDSNAEHLNKHLEEKVGIYFHSIKVFQIDCYPKKKRNQASSKLFAAKVMWISGFEFVSEVLICTICPGPFWLYLRVQKSI